MREQQPPAYQRLKICPMSVWKIATRRCPYFPTLCMTRMRSAVAAATAVHLRRFENFQRPWRGCLNIDSGRFELTKQCAVQAGRAGLAVLLAAGFAVVVPRQASPQDQSKPSVEVKRVPVHYNNEVEGAPLYHAYCATCHGPVGKGNGPAAPALKTPPPDLTVLAKNNNGRFPDLKVMHILENGMDLSAHGSKDMPIWGPIFRSMGPDYVGHMRQVNLTHYLQSIQVK